ncbi:arginyl-tRNA synthetase [Rhodotorula toruloides]|uniref:arginine--tRNA ligase n=1 Tax=Rhodotorula toruloides (strain NP11) TaxID=1130832 RepID=M7X4A4_RHOT1|nr:arginyl-tRNA synthetase [Rhodotorula toruloides NP11]EMS24945.1 arginyl-tRNA synthetase [Rhodotorula toruloides NP11]
MTTLPPFPLPATPSIPDEHLASTPALDLFKLAAAEFIHSVLPEVDVEKAFEGVESGKTGKNVQGDFTVAVPRFRLKAKPNEVAEKLAAAFKPTPYLASVSANGAFVFFNCQVNALASLVLNQVNTQTYLTPDEDHSALSTFANLSLSDSGADKPPAGLKLLKKNGYGTNQSGKGKNIIVEFSSPNIAKPFHAGHLRSTIIGAFLANLYEANGYNVLRMNYLGDWGKQFGILAVGFERYGSEEELEKDAITHLYDVYVKINKDGETDESIHDRAREFFVKMEAGTRLIVLIIGLAGDEEAVALWKKFRDLSIVKYKETYARLNIYFDLYSGESQVSQKAQTDALEALQKSGIVEESQGALIVDLRKYKLEKTVVRKKDGTSVYITRDIGGAVERYEKYKFDKMVYVVASQQDLHLAQFFKVLDLMGYDWAKTLQHVNFGMVLGMSTRKGTAVFLEQILDESKRVMHDVMRKNEDKYAAIEDPEYTSDKLGITAVKVQDMSGKRINNYEFKWERMTSFEGDTGPYLQYAHVRLSSVERKNAPDVVLPPPAERPSTIDTSLLTEPKAREILLLLGQYPDVVRAALKSLEPSTICTFAFRLSHLISSAWETLIVKGQPRDVALARLWLYVSAKDVLGSAMRLLTLEPLERM